MCQNTILKEPHTTCTLMHYMYKMIASKAKEKKRQRRKATDYKGNDEEKLRNTDNNQRHQSLEACRFYRKMSNVSV